MDQHDERMREAFPGFTVVFKTSWGIAWKGYLQPISQKYQIMVTFFPGSDQDDLSFQYGGVKVYLLDPPAQRREKTPDEPVPHLYHHEHPVLLCLYRPHAGEWNVSMPIAETIIPWAAEWLANYELWHVTGEWLAPSEHPDALPQAEEEKPARMYVRSKKYEYLLLDQPLMRNMLYLLRKNLSAKRDEKNRRPKTSLPKKLIYRYPS
ncbi:MAG: hypothetical protein DYH13_04095 [Alphaproteobacteria bacterium PRO2]|nr:hypothetical protein [Alphaproteobacteria bacterium PRO2]